MALFLKKLLSIFSQKEKIVLFLILVLLVITASLEVMSIAFFAPFFKIATDPTYLQNNIYLLQLYNYFNFSQIQSFIIFLGSIAVFILLISSCLTMISNWTFIQYTHFNGYNLSGRLFLYYLSKPWNFHLVNEKNFLTKKIIYDVETLISQILIPFLFLCSKVISIIFIFAFLLFTNFYLTCYLFFSFFLFYYIFFFFIKKKLSANSVLISHNQQEKIKILNDTISGIRDIILANKKNFFYENFFQANKIYHKKIATVIALSQIPRGILEIISIITILVIFIIYLNLYNDDLAKIIPILAIYALSGFKLIPALQNIFQNLSIIKGSLHSFNLIINDLILSKVEGDKCSEALVIPEFLFEEKISLNQISYNYPSRNFSVLNNLNLEIKKNKTTSIIGPNGSGKSTVIYIILGLVSPTSGFMLIDGKKLDTQEKIISWQKKIGYVSQNIFLFNDTILNNITFGLDQKELNFKVVLQIIKFCDLDKFIDSLPDGLNTQVGDNGISLSGGQKQKIAIARCLIKKSDIIIFDEATSALDPVSEKNINNFILKLSGKKTIINITHKMDSIKNSDNIYYINNGTVVAEGSYEEVMKLKKIK
jgi:ABC-type bacteriocin/lantibiotic exporter with double-glycine peptidase domain